MQNKTWQDLTRQGMEAFRQNQYQDALILLQHAERKAPGVREVRYWLANALRMTGNSERAQNLFRQLLAENPADTDAAFGLGYLLLSLGRTEDAADVLHATARQEGIGTEGLLQIAGFLRNCNRFDAAIELCRQARDLEPERADLHFKLARLYQGTGDFERARNTLHQVLDLDPATGPAWTLLAQQKQFTDREDSDFLRLEQAALGSLGEEADMCVAFALGKALDDLGDYPGAWEQYTRGNRIKAASQAWNPRQWTDYVRECTATLPSPAPGRIASTRKPVFIVGMPRSGTTLLEQMLDRHPGIEGRGETNLLAYFAGQLQQGGALSPSQKREMGDYFWDQLRQQGAADGVYVDKNPLNFRYLGQLFQLLPDARVLHVERDGRDSGLSCYFQLFEHDDMAFSYKPEHIVQFHAGYRELMAHWQNTWPQRIHSVRYAELVKDSKNVLAEVLEFIGVDWNEAVMQITAPGSVVRTASVWQARQKVHSRSVARWRNYHQQAPEFFDRLAHTGKQ